MEVTSIRMNLLNNAGGIKAIGSFSLDDAFAIRGIRVMEDSKGRNFVAFPSRERSNGDYEDIAFPLSKEFYHKITDAIMTEFNRMQIRSRRKTLTKNRHRRKHPIEERVDKEGCKCRFQKYA